MKQFWLILFALSYLNTFALDNNIYYVLIHEDEYKIKCEIDSLSKQYPQQHIYIYIDKNLHEQSLKIYVLNRDSVTFGDKSNRKLIVSDSIYPICFSSDFDLGTFSPINEIGKYGERDGTYLKKKFWIENTDPIICSGYNKSKISDILYHSFGVNKAETTSLDSLNYNIENDTIYIKYSPKANEENDIYVWRGREEIVCYSNLKKSAQCHLTKLDKYLAQNWDYVPRYYNTPRYSTKHLNCQSYIYRIIFSCRNRYFVDYIKFIPVITI